MTKDLEKLFDDPRRAGYAADVHVGYSVWRADRNEVDVGLESAAPTFVSETEDHYSRDLLNLAIVVGYRRRQARVRRVVVVRRGYSDRS